MPEGKITKRKFSESDVSSSETNDQSEDEEFLPTSYGKSIVDAIKTPKRSAAKKSKQIESYEFDSDAKPGVKNHQKKSLVNKSLQNKTARADEKCMYQTSRKLPKETVRKNKHVEKSKAIRADSTDSEDEPLDFLQKKSADKSTQNNSSSEEEYKPVPKVNGSSKRNDHELENESMSHSSTQIECLPSKRLKYEEISERTSVSSDEHKSITKIVPKVEELSENDFTIPKSVVVAIKSKIDINNPSKNSSRSSTSYVKDNSDEENVSDPEQRSKEDKADMVSIITLSSDGETLPRCSSKQSKSRQCEIEISKERRGNSPGEDDPSDKISDSRTKESSKKVPELSSCSEDEPIAKKSKTSSYLSKRKKREPIQLEDNRQDESTDEEESVGRIAETLGSKKAQKDISGKIKRSRRNIQSSEQEVVKLAITSLKEIIKPSLEPNTEDEFSVAGKKYVFDLKVFNKNQRIIFEKLLSELVYYAKLNKLNEYTTIELNSLQPPLKSYSRSTGIMCDLNENSTVKFCTHQSQKINQLLNSDGQPFTSSDLSSQPNELLLPSEDNNIHDICLFSDTL